MPGGDSGNQGSGGSGARRQRRRVVQQRRDLGAAAHVDRRVMDLGEDGEAVGRQVAGTRRAPRRGTAPTAARDRSSGRAWMREAWMQNWRQSPGFGSAMWRTWYSRSKLVVLDPVREIEFERHAQQLLPEDRRQVQPALDVLQQALEMDPAVRGRSTGRRSRCSVMFELAWPDSPYTNRASSPRNCLMSASSFRCRWHGVLISRRVYAFARLSGTLRRSAVPPVDRRMPPIQRS